MERKSRWFFGKVFGLWIAVGRRFGNCFSPAVVLEWHGFCLPHTAHGHARKALRAMRSGSYSRYSQGMIDGAIRLHQETLSKRNRLTNPAWLTLTIRTKDHTETRCYFYGFSGFGWNSEHIAKRFGKASDQDHGLCYFYNGLLGSHADV